MAIHHDGPAPYGPPASVIEVLEAYRNRGLPTPITTEVLARVGVSDALSNRVFNSLRLLDLTDEEGHPTDILAALKLARGEDEYKERLGEWLRGAYADVLQFADPAVDTVEKVTEAFRGLTPDGQRSRMVTLMLGLFRYAGLIEGDVPRAKTVPRKPPRQRARASTTQRWVEPVQTRGFLDDIRERINGSEPASAVAVTPASGLHPGLVGLIQQIPRDGGWTKRRRDEFLRAFEAVLDFSVPVNEERELLSDYLPNRQLDDELTPAQALAEIDRLSQRMTEERIS